MSRGIGTPLDLILEVATVKGKLKKGGLLDMDATSRIVLHDWNEGKIPYYTMPSTGNAEEPAEAKIYILTDHGKEFNGVEVYGGESSFVGNSKCANDFLHVEIPSIVL